MSTAEPGQARAAFRSATLWRHVAGLLVVLVVGGLAGWGASMVLPPSYRAESTHAVITSGAGGGAGLAGLGGLAGLPGLAGAGGGRANLDQAIALIQTDDTLDSIATEYGLGALWKLPDPDKLRRKLQKRLRLWVGQKDQLVRIEVAMPQAELAARISNDLGRRLASRTAELATAEARNRRQTLEVEVRRAQSALQTAQQQLVRAQLSPGQMRADSRSTGELMARLQTELGAVEARVAAAATVLTPSSAEMRQLLATRDALRGRLDGMRSPAPTTDFGYTEAFREFKYQEAVLEILLRQYETARIDEVKGGQYVHAVQVARPAQRPAFPDPALLTATGALALGLVYGITAFFRQRRALAR